MFSFCVLQTIYEYRGLGELRNHSLVVAEHTTTTFSKQNNNACTTLLRLYFMLLPLM